MNTGEEVSTKIMEEYPERDSYSYSEKAPLVEKSERLLNFDNALDSTGVGFFHFILVLVAGWALASDSVEVQCISFVTPQLGHDPDPPLRPSNVSYFVFVVMVPRCCGVGIQGVQVAINV